MKDELFTSSTISENPMPVLYDSHAYAYFLNDLFFKIIKDTSSSFCLQKLEAFL